MATILSQAHLYIGQSMFGKIAEFKFPDIEAVTTEIKPIDSLGKYDLPVGINLSDSTIKFIGFDSDAFTQLSDMFKEHIVIVRGNLRIFNGAALKKEIPVKGTIRCTTKKITPLGTIKGQENSEFSVELNPLASKIEYEGAVLNEIDLPNNILIINGVDKLSQTRQNLGLV